MKAHTSSRKRKPRIVYYKPVQRRSTPGGTIAPFFILALFIALCLAAWERHMDDVLVDTDPAGQMSISQLIDAKAVSEKAPAVYRTKQAAVLADLWQLSDEDVAKPVDLWH